MSLLLLFPSSIPTPHGWINAAPATASWGNYSLATSIWATAANNLSTWTVNDLIYRDQWSEWATLSWGAITSSSHTWEFMSGLTFIQNTTQGTTWTLQATAT